MSAGVPCRDRKAHRATWEVWQRRCNHSAFNGYRSTSSDYSQVHCRTCGAVWRTKAAYVNNLDDEEARDGTT